MAADKSTMYMFDFSAQTHFLYMINDKYPIFTWKQFRLFYAFLILVRLRLKMFLYASQIWAVTSENIIGYY